MGSPGWRGEEFQSTPLDLDPPGLLTEATYFAGRLMLDRFGGFAIRFRAAKGVMRLARTDGAAFQR